MSNNIASRCRTGCRTTTGELFTHTSLSISIQTFKGRAAPNERLWMENFARFVKADDCKLILIAVAVLTLTNSPIS
ncbi:hypothetical protein [Endozoicomonas euniceicola]|uniref:Uncharacterized protein n=1 Tax=Endozoicomonas euniceicola TaxID=1234143 RepID=A0ABY6GY31_9GAMM|nr:hypothetical protein [Endozoicomonas euniceicola]UYM17708.1 hypothetical protein NX720_07315 [Endozoicomonas euniceicola]